MSLGEEGIIHEQNYKEEKRKAEDVTEFLLKYISLLNGNFQDFFTQNMWEEVSAFSIFNENLFTFELITKNC